MKPWRSWPCKKHLSDHMSERQAQNKKMSEHNQNENWAFKLLKERTNVKWSRQARWGFRIFDLWSHEIGVAVEIDGPEHDQIKDKERDSLDYVRSGIVVLRVKNMNAADMERAISYITKANLWMERRKEMGLLTKAQKAKLCTPCQ